MTLQEFLKQVNGKAYDIVEYKGEEALFRVRQDGLALKFVHKQTPEICLAAVEQNGYALQFVHEQTSEICLAAVKQNGSALHLVHKQTPEICLASVEQNGYALQYVDKSVFEEDVKELTVKDIEKLLGYSIKIVK